MEVEITKFMRVMELRSASMMRFVKEFAEWYRKEYHIHVELTNRSQTPNDYYLSNLHFQIYDDVEIDEYDTAGRGHQLLRLVNSNLKKITDLLGNILKYYTLDATENLVGQVMELSRLLGVENSDRKKLLSPAFLYDLLSEASDRMNGPTKYFDAAGCYSISGLNGTNRYMDELRRNRLSLINDNEFKIAKAFFEYVERS